MSTIGSESYPINCHDDDRSLVKDFRKTRKEPVFTMHLSATDAKQNYFKTWAANDKRAANGLYDRFSDIYNNVRIILSDGYDYSVIIACHDAISSNRVLFQAWGAICDHPMFVRAMVQYFVYRAALCGPKKEGTKASCAQKLSEVVEEDFAQSSWDGLRFMECVRRWADASSPAGSFLSARDHRGTFELEVTPSPPVGFMHVDLSKYAAAPFRWVVLHIFLGYVLGRVAEGSQTEGGKYAGKLTQRNLDRLLGPFTSSGASANGRVAWPKL